MGMWQQDIVNDPKYAEAFKSVVIYGVAGTNASGKDSLMELLESQGFLHFNTSNSLRQISQAVFQSTVRGGNETPMGIVGNAFRTAYPGGMVDVGLLDYWLRVGVLPADVKPKGLVIGSIRGTGEVARLKEFGGKLIVTDADPQIRYERISGRGRADDPQSYEDFLKHEMAEMAHGETDPTKFGMAAVIEQADIVITNNTNDIQAFKAEAMRQLESLQ